jgi:hypothetical protein
MNINNIFKVNENEWLDLQEQFGDLCCFQAWDLLKKNTKNNHNNDFEDVVQELRMHLLIAGSYYKRQVYIERCLEVCDKFAKDRFVRFILKELKKLWRNRKRHGANRQKFGPFQERLLDRLIRKVVPTSHRPSKKAPLQIDGKFATYCKAIAWNCQKNIGKKITREKQIRAGQVSLSDFDYLSAGG